MLIAAIKEIRWYNFFGFEQCNYSTYGGILICGFNFRATTKSAKIEPLENNPLYGRHSYVVATLFFHPFLAAFLAAGAS